MAPFNQSDVSDGHVAKCWAGSGADVDMHRKVDIPSAEVVLA